MREILTSGSVGGLVEQSPILPGPALDASARIADSLVVLPSIRRVRIVPILWDPKSLGSGDKGICDSSQTATATGSGITRPIIQPCTEADVRLSICRSRNSVPCLDTKLLMAGVIRVTGGTVAKWRGMRQLRIHRQCQRSCVGADTVGFHCAL